MCADIITFGFPCQDLSHAGKRAGLAGARSHLFFEAIRIIREIKPECFIFENVKGLFTSDGGADFIRCLREVADIGLYDCEWQLVDSGWFLPQDRERIYFVGRLRGKSGSKIFPFGESNEKAVNCRKVIQLNKTEKNHQQDRVYSIEGHSPCLNSLPGGNLEPKIVVPVLTPGREKKRQNDRRFKNNGDNSFTLTTQDQHGVFDGNLVRRLTPLECERLQGFPDYWTDVEVLYKNGKIKRMYDKPRYEALGNAVSVCWPEWIGKKLLGEG